MRTKPPTPLRCPPHLPTLPLDCSITCIAPAHWQILVRWIGPAVYHALSLGLALSKPNQFMGDLHRSYLICRCVTVSQNRYSILKVEASTTGSDSVSMECRIRAREVLLKVSKSFLKLLLTPLSQNV